jgi:hypothetical protein
MTIHVHIVEKDQFATVFFAGINNIRHDPGPAFPPNPDIISEPGKQVHDIRTLYGINRLLVVCYIGCNSFHIRYWLRIS